MVCGWKEIPLELGCFREPWLAKAPSTNLQAPENIQCSSSKKFSTIL
jgi:hypothetical protein